MRGLPISGLLLTMTIVPMDLLFLGGEGWGSDFTYQPPIIQVHRIKPKPYKAYLHRAYHMIATCCVEPADVVSTFDVSSTSFACQYV